ncbi:uncharacterized protein LOC144612796 isoform X2 [Panthera onca]
MGSGWVKSPGTKCHGSLPALTINTEQRDQLPRPLPMTTCHIAFSITLRFQYKTGRKSGTGNTATEMWSQGLHRLARWKKPVCDVRAPRKKQSRSCGIGRICTSSGNQQGMDQQRGSSEEQIHRRDP